MTTPSPVKPPRRYEALAFILDYIVREGSCPSFDEIGDALDVKRTRVRELMGQLTREGIIDRVPGKKRFFRIRDVARARMILVDVLHHLGAATAIPLGELRTPRPYEQLPMLPAFEHLPNP